MDKQTLIEGGVDVDDALSRVLGNEQLLARLLRMFLDDTNLARLEEAASKGDDEDAFEAAHALKGVAANLSVIHVAELAGEACERFREGESDAGRALVPKIANACAKARTAIEQAV